MIDQILPLILPNFYLLEDYDDGHRLAIKLKKRILKYRLTCRVINENMDKAISQFPELSYLLLVDKVNLYHAIKDKRIKIEPFLRDFHSSRVHSRVDEDETYRLSVMGTNLISISNNLDDASRNCINKNNFYMCCELSAAVSFDHQAS